MLAISIDTSKTDWMNFIKSNNLDWLNLSDLKGWDGKSALDYYIYATPTMFIIDNKQKLISKPKSVMEISNTL